MTAGKEIEVKKAPEFVKRTLEPCGIFKLAALLGQSRSLRIAETAPYGTAQQVLTWKPKNRLLCRWFSL